MGLDYWRRFFDFDFSLCDENLYLYFKEDFAKMISSIASGILEVIFYIAGNPNDFAPAINIPFVMSIIFLMVLVWDICHMIGVLIHG